MSSSSASSFTINGSKANLNRKNDETELFKSAASTVAAATAASSLSERIKALENAGMKDQFVKKRVPSYSNTNLQYENSQVLTKIYQNAVQNPDEENNDEDEEFAEPRKLQNPNIRKISKSPTNFPDSRYSFQQEEVADEKDDYENDRLSRSSSVNHGSYHFHENSDLNDEELDESNLNSSIPRNNNFLQSSGENSLSNSLLGDILNNNNANQNNVISNTQSQNDSRRSITPNNDQDDEIVSNVLGKLEDSIFKNRINYDNEYNDDDVHSSVRATPIKISSENSTPRLNESYKNVTSTKDNNTNQFINNSYSNNKEKPLIFNTDYTKGMNQNYHTDHFNCFHCDASLTGSRYILKDDNPHCIRCYEELFAHPCEECKRKIGTDSKDLSYKDRHWHEKCFFCSVCKIPLVDKPFGSKNDALYCGECYNQAFASRCDKCGQIFKPGMKKMEYKGQQFHENCFVCFSCNIPIGTKSFIPKDNKIYCVPCYEDHFATKCTRCVKVISQGGVTYKNQPFHRECFTCTNCHQSLAGQRFTSRDDHPYCSECFGKLFAKKCYECKKPITGIGGTKYISFEDRHWHNDCFSCKRCQTSLVGRGFLTEESDILCPECGRTP